MPKSWIIDELRAQLEDHDKLVIIWSEDPDDEQDLLVKDVRYNGDEDLIEIRVEREA